MSINSRARSARGTVRRPKPTRRPEIILNLPSARPGCNPILSRSATSANTENVVAALDGADSAAGIIVVGAHYDTVPQTPGADDNASGVAVLLELARLLGARPLNRGLRFVAFANEEPPHFLTKDMGSLYHARRSAERGDVISLMISLEMLGYYSSEPGSQGYPPPFQLFLSRPGELCGLCG